jgi:RNA polymerase sigma factor (sigma-70 family)
MPAGSTRDEAWFTDLYTAHHLDVVRYHARRLGNLEEAVELAQEVFAVAWRRRVDVPERGLPWLYGVARRVLANRLRADRSRPGLVPLEHPDVGARDRPVGTVAADDRVSNVLTALSTLPKADQELLRLIGWEELSPAEVAVVLGCTRATVAVRLHRARRRLADALAHLPVQDPAPAHHRQTR